MKKARVYLLAIAAIFALSTSAAAAVVYEPFEWYTVSVGSAPGAIGWAPGRVFVANTGSGTVSVIDELTGDVVRTTPVGPAPHGIAVNLVTSRVYVAIGESNKVAVLNSITGNLIGQFTIPQCTGPTGPWGITAHPLTNVVYVGCYSANVLVALDGTTGAILKAVPTGGGPLGVVVDPVTNLVYLGQIGERAIRVLEGSTLLTVTSITRDISAGIWGLALDPVTHRVFAANYLTGTVQTIVGTRVISTTGGFSGPEWIAFDPVRQRVWVPEFNAGNRVTALDTLTGAITPVLISGSKPTSVAVNPAGLVYSGNFGNLSVSVIFS